MERQLQVQANKRKTVVWTRDKISQLIDLYKKHECLWNHWNEAYKNKDKRNRAIEVICKTLNVKKIEFGKKIHNLRNQFNTEMKKWEQRIEESGVNIDDSKDKELICKWSHFESLMFLRNVIEPRPAGYQTNFPPNKKMRLKFDLNPSEDDIIVTTVLPISRGSSNATNAEDLSEFQLDDNGQEEVITDDYQSFENEAVEGNSENCTEEYCDKKYQPPQELPSRSCIKSTKNKKSVHFLDTSSTFSSRTDITNTNNAEASSIELHSNSIKVAPPQSHISTASSSPPSITSSVVSSIPSLNTSNKPTLRDQWDAFGELVANEFRNLNSEISRKRLKRKVMQAMLEVGEEDDNLISNCSRSS